MKIFLYANKNVLTKNSIKRKEGIKMQRNSNNVIGNVRSGTRGEKG